MGRVLIIGGGVAGPTAALALRKAGLEPAVYEAYPVGGEDVGAFLTIMNNGMDALAAIDAAEAVEAVSFPATTVEFLDGAGRLLAKQHIAGQIATGHDPCTLRRSALYRALTEEAERRGIPVSHGKRLVDAVVDGDRVVAVFEDGSEAVGDVLIGADGIGSRVRSLIDAAAPTPRYTGLNVLYGYTDDPSLPVSTDSYRMIQGKRAFFGYTTSPRSETFWFARLPGPELTREEIAGTTLDGWRRRAAEFFTADNTPSKRIIEATWDEIIGGNAYDVPSTPSWHRGPMVLVGDAAHAASPAAGRRPGRVDGVGGRGGAGPMPARPAAGRGLRDVRADPAGAGGAAGGDQRQRRGHAAERGAVRAARRPAAVAGVAVRAPHRLGRTGGVILPGGFPRYGDPGRVNGETRMVTADRSAVDRSAVDRGAVEQRGIEHVPDEERYGTPRRQFWVWSAANLSMLPVGYGLFVVAVGLNWWQAMLAVVIGIALSYPLVGAVAIAGTRGGAPAMMLSRAAFGVLGSRLPTLITYVTVVGWETVSVALGALATRTVLERLSPGLGSTAAVAVAFAVIALGTIVLGVYGFHVIQRVQRWLTLITAVVTVVYLIVVLPRLHFDLSGGEAGSGVIFLGGIVLTMAGTGLGWLAAGADYSRYLPRNTPSRAVLGWTAAGGGVTQGLLVLVGVLLSTGDPVLAGAVSKDPIGALAAQAPTWFLVPYLISVIISVTAAGAVDLYSSGLVLQAIGVRLPRPVLAGIDGVLMIIGGLYMVFVAPTFASVFEAFLLITGTAAAAWAAVFLVDLWLHRRDGYDTEALDDARGRYGRFNWAGIGSMVVGTVVGLGFVTSADPHLAVVTAFLMPSSMLNSPLALTNLGVVFGFLLSGVLYGALTLRARSGAPRSSTPPVVAS